MAATSRTSLVASTDLKLDDTRCNLNFAIARASSAIRSYRCDLPSTRTMTRNRHNAFMFLSHKPCIRCASPQEKERLNGYGDDPFPGTPASHFHRYPG